MSEYTLEIKQIVDYPRCRIYRQFVQALIADRSIRVSGGSGLFYFVVLCAYANFRTSYKRIDGIFNAGRTVMQEQLTHCREGDMCVEEIVELMKDHHKRETILPRHMCDTKFTLVLM